VAVFICVLVFSAGALTTVFLETDEDFLARAVLLPHITRRRGFPAEECSICMGTESNSWETCELATCGHVFHCQCLRNWLVRSQTCPMCRRRPSPIDVTAAGGSPTDSPREKFARAVIRTISPMHDEVMELRGFGSEWESRERSRRNEIQNN
jgi:hypothetical protein